MKSLIISLLLLLGATNAWADAISVENAYVRHMPPGQKVTGAFMTLKNGSDQDRAAISASSDVAETVELHTHIHDKGVMKMRQVEKIEVAAGAETVLEPGGYHVMLIGLRQSLELGQKVSITLNFDDGSSVPVEAEVKSIMGGMKMDKKSSEHGGKAAEHGGKAMNQ